MAPSHEVSEEPTSKQLSPTVRQLPATAVAVAPSNVALSVSGRYTERAVPTVTVGEAALDCSIAQSLTQNHQQGPSNRETELIREVQTLRAQLEMQTRRAQMAADDQQGRRQTELIRQEREQEKHEEEHRNELTKRHELDKKLLRLKQNITVLKQENEDLKRQVAGLELTIKSKEQTILTQRNMIDNFDRDEGEDEVMIDDDERVESGYRDVV
jgi:chromosome segregation ATPase